MRCDAHTKKHTLFFGYKMYSVKKNYLFSRPLSDTCQNEAWEKLLGFKKRSRTGSKTCSLKKNYLFSVPLSGTHQNEIWEKLLYFKKRSRTGS